MSEMLICPNAIDCPAYTEWKKETKKERNSIIDKEDGKYDCPALTYIQKNKLGAHDTDCATLEILNTQSKLLRLLEDKN